MIAYAARRLLAMVPVLLLVSLLSFFLMYLTPGDPVTTMLQQGGGAYDQSVADEMRARLGLDRPVWEQYLSWLAGIVQGDFGTSISTGTPVAAEIARRLPATAFLAVASMVVTLAVSIPLGFLIAVHRGKAVDAVVRALSFVGASAPGFLVAMVLVFVFAITLHWFSSLGNLKGTNWVLPVATLALCESAVYVRQVRSAVLQELGKDYVRVERLRGIRPTATLARCVLRAVAPTLLVLTGMSVGQLLGGTAIIETVFNWPGVGQYAVQAVFARDYPVIQGYVLLMAVIYLVVNLLVDIAQAALDPRVRADMKAPGRLTRRREGASDHA